jgi:tetratricopeptide (TPR) repeat protein
LTDPAQDQTSHLYIEYWAAIEVGEELFSNDQFDEALARFRSALVLAQSIRTNGGETPDEMRNESIAWEKIGDATYKLIYGDDFKRIRFEAQTAYEESVKISRSVLERFGETADSLADLLPALERVTMLSADKADLTTRFAELLGIARRRRALAGDTHEAIRDELRILRIYANRLAIDGRLIDSKAAFLERLALERLERELLGDTEENLYFELQAIQDLGMINAELGDFEALNSTMDEGLSLAREMRSRFGASAATLSEETHAFESNALNLKILGMHAAAIEQLNQALTLVGENLARFGNNRESLKDGLRCHYNLAELHYETSREEALKHARASVNLAETIEAQPANPGEGRYQALVKLAARLLSKIENS